MDLQPTTHRSSRAAPLTLVALESLPCGCVSGVYQANPTVVELELVEAKGPHCVFPAHRPGGVVRLGLPDDIPDMGDEATV
ncbi:MAG: hypothetical protein ACRD26_05430 [Vicinamibacterales bacterium]